MGDGSGKIILKKFEKMLALFCKVGYFKNIESETANNQPNKIMNNQFTVNQIVKGAVAGTFVILGFRKIGGEDYAQIKEVNPEDHTQTAPGEFALPLVKLKPLN